MKLGLVIKITNGGVAEVMSINKDESWASYIPNDVRLEIKVLNNYDGTEKTVFLAKFLGTAGYLIALVKSAPKGSTNWRNWDNTTAWIHVPATCDISNIEIVSVLQKVETAISASKGIDTDLLSQVFNIDYNVNDVLISAASTIVSKNDAGYAVRYYNKDYTLKELLGISIAQQEYSNYKGVFFIDANESITSNCKELNFEPKKICSFPPVNEIDGFKACFYLQGKYIPYNKSIEVPIGSKISIFWVKNGYSPIAKSFVAQENNSCLRSLSIARNEYFILVSRNEFRVSTINGNPISNFDIRINNELMVGDSIEVAEAAFKQGVLLSVCAEGYSEWRKSNVRLEFPMDIKLQKRVYHYEFAIPAYVGEHRPHDALVTIETHHRLTGSPIEGYSLNHEIYEGEGRINRIFYNYGLLYKLKYIGIGIASSILAILLWAGWQAFDNYEFNLGWPPFKEFKQQPQELSDSTETKDDPQPEVTENVDSINAVAYLSKNSTWEKDSLDKYETTRGLFEELNEFKKDEIIKRENKLGNVQRFLDIIDAFNNTTAYDFSIGKENNNGKYNHAADKEINVENYIKWISTMHDPNVYNASNTVSRSKSSKKSPITGKSKKNKKTVSSSGQSDTGKNIRGGAI